LIGELYAAGADPAILVQDLLDLTHWLTRLKLAPEAASAPTVPETDRVRGAAMAGRLGMAELTRTWQMLLKGLGELQQAPAPLQALEMLIIRLTYAAELPSPAAAVEALSAGRVPTSSGRAPAESVRRDGGIAAVAVPSPPTPSQPPAGDGPRAALATAPE